LPNITGGCGSYQRGRTYETLVNDFAAKLTAKGLLTDRAASMRGQPLG